MTKEEEDQSALQKGQEFLDGFKKLGYNRDRIGQSFVQKVGARPKHSNDIANDQIKDLDSEKEFDGNTEERPDLQATNIELTPPISGATLDDIYKSYEESQKRISKEVNTFNRRFLTVVLSSTVGLTFLLGQMTNEMIDVLEEKKLLVRGEAFESFLIYMYWFFPLGFYIARLMKKLGIEE
jgi:hypothetical protein